MAAPTTGAVHARPIEDALRYAPAAAL